jgi:ferredoxin
MKMRVDSKAWMGHGQCYAHASDVYQPDDEGYCVVIEPDVEGELLREAIEGAEACPERAITVDKP